MAKSADLSTKKIVILTENDEVPGSKFTSCPEDYTVDQLKRWLKCRGSKQSGKRQELITRVKDCIASGNHHLLDPGIDGGKWLKAKEDREHGSNLTDHKSLVPDPPQKNWGVFPSSDIPSLFNYGHVYHYALETLPASTDNFCEEDENDQGIGHMTDKPFKNGRKYVDSDFVHDVEDNRTQNHYFVRAHVWLSMRGELPHNVLITISVHSGAVLHATCELCKVSALGRCSHVIAVSLLLVDHVQKHGSNVTTPCTSKECTWNKGKKRKKTPKRISQVDYPNKKKKAKLNVIDFDPRPLDCRAVSTYHINRFVVSLQSIQEPELSMWETQLKIVYQDYKLSSEREAGLVKQVHRLLDNLTPTVLGKLPGTRAQSQSENWCSERLVRLTASTALEVLNIGKLVSNGATNAGIRASKYISNRLWHLDGGLQTTWMKYGLESEAKAIEKYKNQTKKNVTSTGLWVNPKYPYLACSPDGLVDDDGLVEIKSLKLFKEHEIQKIVKNGSTVVSKDILDRQCFEIKDGKCVLKESHSYYHQIQLQLLVTERTYCDFVLYAADGPVSIETINRDEQLMSEILNHLSTFWFQVVSPEIFEMRVPRDLLPFILPKENFPSIQLSKLTPATNKMPPGT